MLEEVLFATFSMIVICTSFPAAAGAPRVYAPLKSLEDAAKALSVNTNNEKIRTRRDVRAEIMVPPLACTSHKTKNDSRIENAFRD